MIPFSCDMGTDKCSNLIFYNLLSYYSNPNRCLLYIYINSLANSLLVFHFPFGRESSLDVCSSNNRGPSMMCYRIMNIILLYCYAFHIHISLTTRPDVKLLEAVWGGYLKGWTLIQTHCAHESPVLYALQPHHNMIMPMWMARGVGMVKW